MKKQACASLLTACVLMFSACSAEMQQEQEAEEFQREPNAITLLEQQDRRVEWKPESKVSVKKGISPVTGLKSSASYNPVLVELNNENGGVYVTAPTGITEADFIYEYQTKTDGSMGMCALFNSAVPDNVGPMGNASVGGILLQSEWGCGYVYTKIPTEQDGSVSELGYSISSWISNAGLAPGSDIFPGDVSSVKGWKKYIKEDKSMIVDENQFVDVSGIKKILESGKHQAKPCAFKFLTDTEKEVSDIPVVEVDIRTASKTFSSGFVYDKDSKVYRRWVGVNNQYGDADAQEQLGVSNLIIQRITYTTSNKNMAPNVIGCGNADIFMLGSYIEGYWVREKEEDRTAFYDADGNLISLAPGTTFVSLLSNSTPVVIYDY